ncbi:hypothetical protein PGTUg99_020792 [Puccinia graminis f. sp. tritici]|uniref:Uncharacterized protein n=1 Tax=Puccinia graminis f. sp. tritici TaxID=56615 RepID=A0A5B0SPE7_PUCGR|nr:hypothetical protein PGTUg99_020792 [Puccinia graminis f. sp. tritici]
MNAHEETAPSLDTFQAGMEQLPRAPRVSMNIKLDTICALIEDLNLTPKSFILAFLEHDQDSMAFKRRFWATNQGWDSTKNLLLAIRRLAYRHLDTRQLWEGFILEQATELALSQKPTSGLAPEGSYHTSSTLSNAFFTKEGREAQNKSLTDWMLFLYQLLCSKIEGGKAVGGSDAPEDPVEENSDDKGEDNPLDDLGDYDGSVLKKSKDRASQRANRVHTMARTICAMVAFGGNCCHNGFQLSNALLFLAGGVTERVSAYLNYIGISSSRQTAHAALTSLGAEA